MNIKRFNSTAELFQFLAAHFLTVAIEQISKKGTFNIAVSGGSTPLQLFQILGKQKNSLDWSKVNFFWVDERWVPMNDSQNNYGEAMRAGLKKLNANFYPFDTTMESPVVSSKAYAQQMMNVLPEDKKIDLTLLGAGVDGHTASIFNNNLAIAQGKEIAFVTSHPVSGQVRLSLTLPTITKSSEVLVVLVGEEKRMILEGLLQTTEPSSPLQYAVFNSLNSTVVTDIHE